MYFELKWPVRIFRILRAALRKYYLVTPGVKYISEAFHIFLINTHSVAQILNLTLSISDLYNCLIIVRYIITFHDIIHQFI